MVEVGMLRQTITHATFMSQPFIEPTRSDNAATVAHRASEGGLGLDPLGTGDYEKMLGLGFFGPGWHQSPMEQSPLRTAGFRSSADDEDVLGRGDVVPLERGWLWQRQGLVAELAFTEECESAAHDCCDRIFLGGVRKKGRDKPEAAQKS